MKRWLCFFVPYDIDNVAIVESENRLAAIEKARQIFGVTGEAKIVAHDISCLPGGWSYYQ